MIILVKIGYKLLSLIPLIRATPGTHITKPTVKHILSYCDINRICPGSVINAGKLGPFGLLLKELYVLQNFSRQVSAYKNGVIKEEYPSINGYLFNNLTVGCDSSIIIHAPSGQLPEKILQNIGVGEFISSGVVLDGVTEVFDRNYMVLDCNCIQFGGIFPQLNYPKVLYIIPLYKLFCFNLDVWDNFHEIPHILQGYFVFRNGNAVEPYCSKRVRNCICKYLPVLIIVYSY
ncbi:hypothetical protein SDC9_141553 [bioreactor metagenome]|uniref:Uncharacterized protein n=1 Tax=bioreactor metagenome TaxID=1076179 RepID=A0A645DYE9_9ZZZZ